MAFIVRGYNDSDLGEVISIYQSAFAEPPWNEVWTPEQVIEDIEYAKSQQDPIVLVAQNGSGLAGFLWGYRLRGNDFPFLPDVGNATYLDDIAVDGRKRCRGVGMALCERYFKQARERGFSQSMLRTSVGNDASLALFRRNGYLPIMRDGSAVFDPAYPDRIYMRRSL